MAFLHLFWLRGSPFKPSNLSCQRFADWVWWEKCRESGLTQDSSFRRLTLLGGTIFFHINGAWNEKSSIQFENVYSNSLDQLHVSRVVLGTSVIFCFLLFLFCFLSSFCFISNSLPYCFSDPTKYYQQYNTVKDQWHWKCKSDSQRLSGGN